MIDFRIEIGDCRDTLRRLASEGIRVQTCVTSPPYFGLRDYGVDGQIGLEPTPDEYVARMVEVFREVRRVLRDDGTLWLNLGDSYAATSKGSGGTNSKQPTNAGSFYSAKFDLKAAALKPKDLIGIPWRVAFALQADGWYLRQDIIWHKPNPMPESVRDRCTKAHKYVFLLSKSERYYYDAEAVKEPAVRTKGTVWFSNRRAKGMAVAASGNEGRVPSEQDARKETRNRRSVWTVATRPYKGAHFATFPPTLIEPCVLAGSRPGDIVLDPFGGSGTTAGVALAHGRKAILCELNPEYAALVPGRVASIRERSRGPAGR